MDDTQDLAGPTAATADVNVNADAPDAVRPTFMFMGNTYDLMAVVGTTIAGTALFTCTTCNFGFYCLPVIPVLLGIVGLLTTRDAVDPDRTRLLSWISIGIGAAIFILLVLFIALYVGFIFYTITANSGSGY